MKKLLAFTLSLVMSAAFLTACGDEDSSSKKSKDSSATSSSAAAEDSSKGDESSDAGDASSDAGDASSDAGDANSDEKPAAEGDGALTKAYTEKMKEGNYAIEMKASVMGMDTNIALKQNGDDMYALLDLFGEQMEIYKIGDSATVVMPSEKQYGEVPADQIAAYTGSVSTYTIDENSTFVGTSEEDGMTVETFKVPMEMELGEGVTVGDDADTDNEVKYYYDADGNLKKIVTTSPMIGESAVEITSLKFGDVKIELPDRSG
ncbi:MAG: hypothetical protein IKR76_09050 [Ruminococcus sp.]|nr:hypothetical protein [Ruminococcus sp.]